MKKKTEKLNTIKQFLNKNKAVISAVLIVFIIGTFLGMVSEAKEQSKEIAEKFVRFHIVGNSNSKEDQAVKMKVREAIFSELDFSHISSKQEALSYFSEHCEEIEKISERILDEHHFSYGAKVAVAKKDFPVREYSDFVLPAATYDTVTITLGQGKGENFFCVMYPSLCKIEGVTESTNADYQILHHVLSEEEALAITGNKQQIVCKFKILEFFQELFSA